MGTLWQYFYSKNEITAGGKLPLCVQGALLSRDGRRYLGWSYNPLASMAGEAFLWNLGDGKVVRRFEHDQQSAIMGASWDSDESHIVTWGFDNRVNLWSLADPQPLREYNHAASGLTLSGSPTEKLNGSTISADGQFILTWGNDRTVRLWDASSTRDAQRFVHKTGVKGASFSSERASYVLSWSGGETGSSTQTPLTKKDKSAEVSVWNFGNSDAIAVFQHEAAVNGAWMNRAQTQVLTCSDDATAAIWDLKTGKKLQSFRHSDAVLGARFLRGDSLVLTWSRDKTAALWDPSRKLPLAVIQHNDWVDGALTNINQTRMLTWSRDKSARWWDISLHGEHLKPKDRILEFEVRSATQLNAVGKLCLWNRKSGWRSEGVF